MPVFLTTRNPPLDIWNMQHIITVYVCGQGYRMECTEFLTVSHNTILIMSKYVYRQITQSHCRDRKSGQIMKSSRLNISTASTFNYRRL